jgi:anhydro-N-acetylmuramic acid kinase
MDCYIGVMSGTSLDGVDVVLCPVGENSIELAASLEYPFDKALKAEILSAVSGLVSLKKIGEIDHRLGEFFADAVLALIRKYELDTERIEAIGLHGQTMWHQSDSTCPFSMQLGDPNIVTARTGIKTVADFRRKDIALGGEGAPFAPAFHRFLFKEIKKAVCVLNIGGMANITLLGETFAGYDTGPGNVLMDMWIEENRGLAFDRDGEWAKAGRVDVKLLDNLLSEPYFKKRAPKSTGRERFNSGWLHAALQEYAHLSAQDIQATLLELTVCTITDEVRKSAPDLLLVCGGGVKNRFLMLRLKESLGSSISVAATDDYGVSSDYMEAMAFAWLAYKRVHHEKVELKAVTGAYENGVLGGIYE